MMLVAEAKSGGNGRMDGETDDTPLADLGAFTHPSVDILIHARI